MRLLCGTQNEKYYIQHNATTIIFLFCMKFALYNQLWRGTITEQSKPCKETKHDYNKKTATAVLWSLVCLPSGAGSRQLANLCLRWKCYTPIISSAAILHLQSLSSILNKKQASQVNVFFMLWKLEIGATPSTNYKRCWSLCIKCRILVQSAKAYKNYNR